MSYFHIFIFLLIAICLAVTHIIVSYQEYLHHCFGLSGTTSQVRRLCPTTIKLQVEQQILWTLHTQNLCMLFSVHTTIIFTNLFINQTGSYDVITKFVTGPAKTWHICTNYTCLENGIFLGHCFTFCKPYYLLSYYVSYQCNIKLSVLSRIP